MIIAIDFDGTCTTHEYPLIGKSIGAEKVLKALVKAGHQIILYTMRSGEQLAEAEKWFVDNGIELFGVQFNPTQHKWTTSNKCYAQLYIDDAALGIPLTIDITMCNRPYVNWRKVNGLLKTDGSFHTP